MNAGSCFFARIVLVIAYSVQLNAAQEPFAGTENPICYVCFDGGVSTITKPDAIVPLPNNTQGVSEATCETIQISAEVLLLVPEEYCHLLDREDFRILCGCENALESDSESTIPVASPIATLSPISPSPTTQIKTDSPVIPIPTTLPNAIPEDTPATEPNDPTSPLTSVGNNPSSSVPSIISSDVPSDMFSETPSKIASSVPSDASSFVPSNK